ncbi:MAG: cysteine rich repeat-containing protein [Bosea sp. (in: a-proteobacteria)]|uniref:cysteine rich repeat-containing protein n=1 Tax=Bosea sp. (in: a-proteobacteria) TaxID=1871050 RepID=UPI0027327682|nr:cysteine rich repeat-containing protein [Bosea sp. (in: a-proteobacteria)]MDP3320141.1 cysteine rich repeat-containing protein [Bosea sp. (in: a-proteobacteria)]
MNRLFASACAASLFLILAAPPASAQDRAAALRDACGKDIATHCPDVQPGGGRIAACFKQNAAKLSEACRTALKSSAAD